MSNSLDYSRLSDEKLAEMINCGDEQAYHVLLSRYDRFIRLKVSSFDFDKTQYDDYMQEAVLAFITAVKTYNSAKAAFRTYLNICVTRTLISVKRKVKRCGKSDELCFSDKVNVGQITDEAACDPQEFIETREMLNSLKDDIIKKLSRFELRVLGLYLGGNSYYCIAQDLDTTVKSVDNALQRVRCKLKTGVGFGDIDKAK